MFEVDLSRIQRRAEALLRIESAIRKHGHFVYLLHAERQRPRFAYTIGLHEKIGFEVICAGMAYMETAELIEAIEAIATSQDKLKIPDGVAFRVGELGTFCFATAHESWFGRMALGAIDYYRPQPIKGRQLQLIEGFFTRDTPKMSIPFSGKARGAWQYLDDLEPLDYPVTSWVTVDLGALRGDTVIQAARWGADEWQMCSRETESVVKSEFRLVPLSVMLSIDETLEALVGLAIDQTVKRRSVGGDWEAW